MIGVKLCIFGKDATDMVLRPRRFCHGVNDISMSASVLGEGDAGRVSPL